MKIKYATATGIYDEEDFGGPPPFSYDKVVSLSDYERVIDRLRQGMYALTLHKDNCVHAGNAYNDIVKFLNDK